MGKLHHGCLAFLFIMISMFSKLALANDSARETSPLTGGDAATSTKSFVEEACDADTIKSELQQDDPKKSEHEKAAQACHDEVKKADRACQPGTNANAQNAQGQANQYSQQAAQQSMMGAGTGGGQSGKCGGFGDLMKNMQPPMQAYNAECSAAREKCKTSCKAQSEKSKKSCETIKDKKSKQYLACQKNVERIERCNQKTAGACQKYEQQSMAIMAALANAALQVMQMMQCQEDQGLDCAKTPNDPKCTKPEAIVNCTDPKYFAHPDCKCGVNPNQPGCPGFDSQRAANIQGRESQASDVPAGLDSTPGSTSSDIQGGRRGSSAGPQAGAGAGAGMGAGAGGKAASDQLAKEAGAKPLSSDVLDGDYGGGGGGRGGMGGGYPEPDASVGRAVSNAEMLQNAAMKGGLSGPNGRSNWQKVHERYRDEGGSLISTGK